MIDLHTFIFSWDWMFDLLVHVIKPSRKQFSNLIFFLKFREIASSISLPRKQFMSLTDFTNYLKVLLETKGGKLLQKDMLKYILIINQI